MKQTKSMIRLLFLVGCLALIAQSKEGGKASEKQTPSKETNRQEIQWLAYDIGLTKAKAEEKHVFIDFTAKWCGWCKKMDKETFSKPEVVKMLNTNFVPVKVDGDSKRELNVDGYKITERNLTRQEYGVKGYPSFWFLKPDGSKLAVIRGYRQPDYMMQVLEYVKDYKYDTTRTEVPDEKRKTKN